VVVAALVTLVVAPGAAHAAPTGVRLVDHDGRCLDVTAGGKVALAACVPLRGQQLWTFRTFDDYRELIVHDATGRCLRSTGYPAEGTQPYLDTCAVPGSSPAAYTVWETDPVSGGGATYLIAGGRYSMVSVQGALQMRYKNREPIAAWTPTAAPAPPKPQEGGSCGFRACPPKEDS